MKPGLPHRHAQEIGNLLREQRMRAAGKELQFGLGHAETTPG